MRGATACLDLLIKHGADINLVDNKGNPLPTIPSPFPGCSVLHEACTSGSTETVHYLITKGMDVNARDAKGATALHYAAYSARTQVVQILLESGGELDCKNIFPPFFYYVVGGVWYRPKVRGSQQGPTPRYGHSTTLLGNKMYILGGYCSQNISDQLFVFDLGNAG
jgi:ankyrin repeat protein